MRKSVKTKNGKSEVRLKRRSVKAKVGKRGSPAKAAAG